MLKCAAFYARFGQAYCDLAADRHNPTPLSFKRKKVRR
jgi:hypothetical protein